MKKLFYIVCFLAFTAAVSCNKQENPLVNADEILSETEMAFDAIYDPEVTAEVTKAQAATSVTSFKCEATKGTAGSETAAAWNNIVFTSDGNATPTYKAPSPGKYWPLTNQSYHFYAVSARTGSDGAATAATGPDLTFAAAGTTISVAAGDNNKDIICAYLPYGTSASTAQYKVKNPLTFEHIYSRLSTVTVNANALYRISNITIWIVNAKTGGTYNLRTGKGQTNGTGWSSLLPSGAADTQIYKNTGSIAKGTNHTGSNNDMYIVPGDYYLKCTWTATIDDDDTTDDYTQTFTTVTSSTPITLQRGKINAVSVNLTGNATEITFSVTVSAWGSNSISGITFPVS